MEGLGFSIEPWNAQSVERELRSRGLNPVPDNDGKGFESFHSKDPDGFDVQVSNGRGYAKARRDSTTVTSPVEAPFESTGAESHVAQYKSYHTVTPNGYNLQISSSTHDTRLNLALAANPRRPVVK